MEVLRVVLYHETLMGKIVMTGGYIVRTAGRWLVAGILITGG